MFIHFFCLCPHCLTIKLHFNTSKVTYKHKKKLVFFIDRLCVSTWFYGPKSNGDVPNLTLAQYQ